MFILLVDMALLISLVLLVSVVCGQYSINIFPQELNLGDGSHFDHERWNGKNGLDTPGNLPHVKHVGTYAARWLNRDLSGGLFEKAPENPHRKGYPDPNYFRAHQHDIAAKYLSNMQGYGQPEVVMEVKGLNWPHWLDTSHHHGRFPNNVDAAAEFVYLLIDAVDKGTNGKLPTFLEIINEPDAQGQNTNWTTYVNFHKAVAKKLTPKFPHLRVGGPTYTGAAIKFDRFDFRIWNRMEQFLDMAFANGLNFFSFHSYAQMDVRGGTHKFEINSEAKLIGLLDLVDCYSHKKRNKSFNIIISEFGLGTITGINANQISTFLDWAYIYQHNAQIFTFLERRDIVRKVVAFLLTHTDLKGQESINYSILDKNGNERDIAQAFKFWQNIHNTMTFLRVDSQFNNSERKVVSHALVDKSTGTLLILLHNHDQKPVHVKLNFDKGWFHPAAGKSTCERLNAQHKATLESDKAVHVTNSMVTIPPEASCYFQFKTSHKFDAAPIITQSTYYSTNMVIPIHNTAVDVKVNIPSLARMVFARLRIGVSLRDKSANPKPKTVLVNNHGLTSFYSLYSSNSPADDTLWQTYEYQIPANSLLQHNDIKLMFAQTGGYVSTVAVVLGRH